MRRTADAARGKWRGILMALGVSQDFLKDKHGPCPFCGGKDRYRWDNKGGDGSFICSQCGSGNAFELLRRLKGWEFKQAALEVDRVVGNVEPERIKPQRKPEETRAMLARLWSAGMPVSNNDPVSLYLEARGLFLPENRDSIRFVKSCPVPGEAGGRLAMVAKVVDVDGKGVTLHRTFLAPNGRKAAMDEPRALMPVAGEMPEGSCIRLTPIADHIGISEGIETALAATTRFGIPTWAAINATMLAKWRPPEGVKRVTVFGDNDPKFGGAAAAYALAHRLAARLGLTVDVLIPATVGMDWADKEAA